MRAILLFPRRLPLTKYLTLGHGVLVARENGSEVVFPLAPSHANIGATALVCFHRLSAAKGAFHLTGRHGGGSVK